MAERYHEDVDFVHGETDPKVVEQAKIAIMERLPLAYNFGISGWTAHDDREGGYFRISWEIRPTPVR